MKNTMIMWQRVKQQNLPNLNVALVNGEYVGFIYKPNDTKSDKNAWRIYKGVGDKAVFLGHEWNKQSAMVTLNWALVAENATVVVADVVEA